VQESIKSRSSPITRFRPKSFTVKPAQGALRQVTQWWWFEHPTFQIRGGHSITEIIAARTTVALGGEQRSPQPP